MNTTCFSALAALVLCSTTAWADHHTGMFSAEPIWVSGSKNCGGDGNARLLDIDQDAAGGLDQAMLFENLTKK